MRIVASALVAIAMASPAIASCYSIGENAAFCGRDGWKFERYMEGGVLFTGRDDKAAFYHMHRLRPAEGQSDLSNDDMVFREHAVSFLREYQKPQYSDVVHSEGERFGLSSLEYEFTTEGWGEGNRTRLTFIIDGATGLSFVTSGQAPVDPAKLNELHEAALAQFQLMGAD